MTYVKFDPAPGSGNIETPDPQQAPHQQPLINIDRYLRMSLNIQQLALLTDVLTQHY